MLTSVRWLNDYLDPPATAEEQAELATRAGFPLEGTESVEVSDGTDTRQDYEMTSNRGDCVCHVGLAREIAAISGRTLKTPAATPPANEVPASEHISVTNEDKNGCPLYTARVIRGVKVGPSPAWLADRLIARGDLPRNNIVDATNFVLFELGQPTHVFDLSKLEGGQIRIRRAKKDEPFLPIGEGEKEVALGPDDLVIADAASAVAIAGVKGGALSAVTDATTDLVLEAASFDPVAVRKTSRRHGIASESSYRFERGVAPGQVDAAADRLAALILEIAGGDLCDGVVVDGAPLPALRRVSMRTNRCRKVLGIPVTDEQMMTSLGRLGFGPTLEGESIECVVPLHRLDIEREVDLVEEVARMHGLDKIPIQETLEIRVAPPQSIELARQAVANELAGMGFVETVTHSLIGEDHAKPFLDEQAHILRLDEATARGESVLQPAVLPGVLRVRRHNQDRGGRDQGADHLRFFQCASAFWGVGDDHREVVRHALVMDVENEADGLRPLRGVIDRLAVVLRGTGTKLEVTADDRITWLDPGVRVRLGDLEIGRYGRLAGDVADRFGLDDPVLVAELELVPLYDGYPPITTAHGLPSFPAIERDLSPIVAESVQWADVSSLVDGLGLDGLESVAFVTTFRGRGIETGDKALTLRLRFRIEDRTLTHDEVDLQIKAVVDALQSSLKARFRT